MSQVQETVIMTSVSKEVRIIDVSVIEVEIDYKNGKRKHSRVHHVEVVWVIASVESTPKKKMFVMAVKKWMRRRSEK